MWMACRVSLPATISAGWAVHTRTRYHHYCPARPPHAASRPHAPPTSLASRETAGASRPPASRRRDPICHEMCRTTLRIPGDEWAGGGRGGGAGVMGVGGRGKRGEKGWVGVGGRGDGWVSGGEGDGGFMGDEGFHGGRVGVGRSQRDEGGMGRRRGEEWGGGSG